MVPDLRDPEHGVWPGMLASMVGRQLGLAGYGAEVHHRGSVPPDQVHDVWQPGSPNFDRHCELLEAT